MYKLLINTRNSNKLKYKIITVFFVFCMSFVIAFCPIVQTVAYANTVNQFMEAVGFVVGSVSGGYLTSVMLAGVGGVAACTSAVGGFLIVLAAVGAGISLATLISILTSEKSLDAFGVEFWETLANCVDLAKQKLLVTATTFVFLVERTKQVLGISSIPEATDFSFYHYVTDNDNSFTLKSYMDDVDNYIGFSGQHILNHEFSVDFYNDDEKDSKAFASLFYNWDNGIVTIELKKSSSFSISGQGQSHTYPHDALGLGKPFSKGDKLYFPTSASPYNVVAVKGEHPGFILDIKGSSDAILGFNNTRQENLRNLTYNGYSLIFSSNKCYYIDDNTNVYLYCVDDDNNLYVIQDFYNLLYLLFVNNCSIVHSSTAVDSPTELLGSYSTGNISGSISSGNYKMSSAKTASEYSNEVTYEKEKDMTTGVTKTLSNSNSIANDGTITITASSGSGDTVSEDTTLSSAVNIVGITADDVTVTDTETGEITDVNFPPEVVWRSGLELVKNSTSSITNYFPFCIPTYLKSQLNILVAEPESPIFTIPFVLESVNINESIKIDLTRFGSLTKITDFFLVAILIVGLCFSTKKIMF